MISCLFGPHAARATTHEINIMQREAGVNVEHLRGRFLGETDASFEFNL